MSRPRVLFVGISTGGSLAHRAFPRWMELLGADAVLESADLAPGSGERAYRELVRRIRDDDGILGAVITSHKLAVHRAARDLLAPGDPYVDALGEVNAIAGATAHARDPLAVAAVLPRITGGTVPPEVLCLGGGGAGLAVVVSLLWERAGSALLPRAAVPRRVVVTDARAARVADVQARLRALPPTGAAVTVVGAERNAGELARLGERALVVNATGLGKDAPGSPLPPGARFPAPAVAWDANYRGELAFLREAGAQPGVRAHDGWTYFVHGWAQALAPILGLRVDEALVGAMAEVAAPLRSAA